VQCDGELAYKDLIKAVGKLLPTNQSTQVDIQVYVSVPSGGDYSGMDLDVADEPIKFRATWTEVHEQDEDE
jgi:hypothetical protein